MTRSATRLRLASGLTALALLLLILGQLAGYTAFVWTAPVNPSLLHLLAVVVAYAACILGLYLGRGAGSGGVLVLAALTLLETVVAAHTRGLDLAGFTGLLLPHLPLLIAAGLAWSFRPHATHRNSPLWLPRAVGLLVGVPLGVQLVLAGPGMATTLLTMATTAALGSLAWRWGKRPGTMAIGALLIWPAWPGELLEMYGAVPATPWYCVAVLWVVGAGSLVAAAWYWWEYAEREPTEPWRV